MTPTTGRQIAELLHNGPGESGLDDAARRLRGHADDLHGTASDLHGQVTAMAAVWQSDASAQAQGHVDGLAADHSVQGERVAALARRMSAQAADFQALRREVPRPEDFDDAWRRLFQANETNKAMKGMYSAVVAKLQIDMAELNRRATTAYAGYTTKTAENLADPDEPADSGDPTIRAANWKEAPPEDVSELDDKPEDETPQGRPDGEGGTPSTEGSESGTGEGTLGDLFDPDTAAPGTPGDGQSSGLPPALSQLPPPSPGIPDVDPNSPEGQKIAAARQSLEASGMSPAEVNRAINNLFFGANDNPIPPAGPAPPPPPGFGEGFGDAWRGLEQSVENLTGQEGMEAFKDAWRDVGSNLADRVTNPVGTAFEDIRSQVEGAIDNPAYWAGRRRSTPQPLLRRCRSAVRPRSAATPSLTRSPMRAPPTTSSTPPARALTPPRPWTIRRRRHSIHRVSRPCPSAPITPRRRRGRCRRTAIPAASATTTPATACLMRTDAQATEALR